MFALVEKRGEQDDGVERLAAGAQGGDEAAGLVDFAGAEDGLDAEGAGVGEVVAKGFAGLAGDEKGEDGGAGGVAFVLAELEEWIEKPVPAAPRDHLGLLRGELGDGGLKAVGAGILEGNGGGVDERGGADLFGDDELASELRDGRGAGAGGLKEWECDGGDADRERPGKQQKRQPGNEPCGGYGPMWRAVRVAGAHDFNI